MSYLTVACTTETDSTLDNNDSTSNNTSTPESDMAVNSTNPDFNPTPTNTLLPPDTASPLTVTIAKTEQDDEREEQFDLRIRNESNAEVSAISLRIYFTPDADRDGTDYVLATYWDEIEAVTITGPEQVSDTLSYFTIDYGNTVLAPSEEWGYVGGLHLSDWSEDFDETNDWWYSNELTEIRQSASTIPTYINDVLVLGSEPDTP